MAAHDGAAVDRCLVAVKDAIVEGEAALTVHRTPRGALAVGKDDAWKWKRDKRHTHKIYYFKYVQQEASNLRFPVGHRWVG